MKGRAKRARKRAMRVISILMVAAMLATLLPGSSGQAEAAAKKKVKGITLTKPVAASLTMKVGGTYQLKMSVTPKNASNKKMAFKSSKKAVVGVSATGKLKAKKAGTSVIKITAKDGSKVSASVKVTVSKKLVKVNKLTLNKSKATLYVGGTNKEKKLTLKATVKPKKATTKTVKYTSSKTSVAGVSAKGVVTAKKAGKATITAYAADGWGKKATCSVEVKKATSNSTPTPLPPVTETPVATASPEATPTPTPTLVPATTKTPAPTPEPPSGQELATTDFTLVKEDEAPKIYLDAGAADYKGLKLVADSFAGDVELVTETKPEVVSLPQNLTGFEEEIIVVGSIGNNELIDKWIAEKKIYVGAVKPYFETYTIISVDKPEAGINKALVIVGSDKRGAMYGMYHVSEMMGVSPWVYWGDVAPEKKEEISFAKDEINYTSKEPSVRYRGIFLNDEAPSLSSWVETYFQESGEKVYNEKFYQLVYELIIRLKGNYLWPAMWNSRFGTDGASTPSANAELANEYGIVMGTSHHEPMMRADKEWNDKKSEYGNGAWDYKNNKEGLDKFWEDAVKERSGYENVITMGIRGQEDSAIGGTVEENVNLLKDCITSQKRILTENGLEDAPKVLTLYKEVEEFWYGSEEVQGLKEWDQLNDVTIMLAEDNFGNLRTLPTQENKNRGPGWGMYYHFDYHGAPTSYEWVNTLQLEKTWEQMSMAYDYGVKDVWIVNVGDLKPMEMPISFFLDMAYDFDKWGTSNKDSADEYVDKWVEEQFGKDLEEEGKEQGIKDLSFLLREYTKLNGARKPEIVASNTYHATNYNEAMRMLDRIDQLIKLADDYKAKLPSQAQAAYFQLVYYPAVASANVHRMQIYTGLMNLYMGQGRAIANHYADLVKEAIEYDKELQDTYNKDMPGVKDKWKGMMSSVHVGYKAWNDEGAEYPDYKAGYFEVPEEASMLVALQGDSKVYKAGNAAPLEFTSTNKETYFVDIANEGGTAFEYRITTDKDWIQLMNADGTALAEDTATVLMQNTIGVTIDMEGIGSDTEGRITIRNEEADIEVIIPVSVKYVSTSQLDPMTYVEEHGYISMEAAHFANSEAGEGGAKWEEIKNYGKSLSSIKVWPTTAKFTDATQAPYVEYKVKVSSNDTYVLQTYVAPSNNVSWSEVTMKYGVSVDEGEVVLKDTIDGTSFVAGDYNSAGWSNTVKDNIRLSTTEHVLTAGEHTIRIYAVDPALVLQKLVLYPKTKGLAPSYFGPEESYYVGKGMESSLVTNAEAIKDQTIQVASCKIPANEDHQYDVLIPVDGEYKVAVDVTSDLEGTVTVNRNNVKAADIEITGAGTFNTSKLNWKQTTGKAKSRTKDVISLIPSEGIEIESVKVLFVPKYIEGEPIYVRASSEVEGLYATNAYDKNKRTIWKSEDSDASPYLEFDFGDSQYARYVDRITLSEIGENVNEYEIQVYDGTKWNTAYEGGKIVNGETIFLHGTTEIRGYKMRLVFTDVVEAPSISEVDFTPYINWTREDAETTLKALKYEGHSMQETILNDKDGNNIVDSVIDGDRTKLVMEVSGAANDGGTKDEAGTTTTDYPSTITFEFGEKRMVDTFNIISVQADRTNPVAPNLSMTSAQVQRKYSVSYWDETANAWSEKQSVTPNEKVFNTIRFAEPVLTDKVKLYIDTTHWLRIVEFEAIQTKYSTAVEDYSKSRLASKGGNEVTLSEAEKIDKIQCTTSNKDGAYAFEYAATVEASYTAISPDDIKATVKTEDGVYILLKEAIEVTKVKVTPPSGATIGDIELWGLVPEPPED